MTAESSRSTPVWAQRPLQLTPRYVERLWGGIRFPANDTPVGEAWLVHEGNVITSGSCAGISLADATEAAGEALLGSLLWNRGERRFPLLLKLIDAREWLSIQVHPDDDLATELEGEGFRGKTEAWYVLDADPGSEVIVGVRPGTTAGELAASIRDGSIESIVERAAIRDGDVIGLPAGTVHALGPGLFLYEIQQSSDLTYRVFDWNRPAAAGRRLHQEESIRAANPSLSPQPQSSGVARDGELRELVALDPFVLSKGLVASQSVEFQSGGEIFFIVTVIEGKAKLTCGDTEYNLEPFGTVIIPAASEVCRLEGDPVASFLVARPG